MDREKFRTSLKRVAHECFQIVTKVLNYIRSKCFRCSPRIRQICWDHGLWRKIHDCCNGFSPSHNPLLPTYTDSTTRIKISSTRKVILRQRQRRIMSACLGRNFFKKLESLPNLKTFILENHRFDIVTVRRFEK